MTLHLWKVSIFSEIGNSISEKIIKFYKWNFSIFSEIGTISEKNMTFVNIKVLIIFNLNTTHN